jgi:hypothetical protein
MEIIRVSFSTATLHQLAQDPNAHMKSRTTWRLASGTTPVMQNKSTLETSFRADTITLGNHPVSACACAFLRLISRSILDQRQH